MSEIQKMEQSSIGAWEYHNKIKKIPNIKQECEVCKQKFPISKQKNTMVIRRLIYIDSKIENEEYHRGFWIPPLPAPIGESYSNTFKNIYEEVNQINIVCPFCGNQKEFGCISLEKKNSNYSTRYILLNRKNV